MTILDEFISFRSPGEGRVHTGNMSGTVWEPGASRAGDEPHAYLG
jgi:hypothetical protein